MCSTMPARNSGCALPTGWTTRSSPRSGIVTSTSAKRRLARPQRDACRSRSQMFRTIHHRPCSTSSFVPVFAPCWLSRCSVPTGSSARWWYAARQPGEFPKHTVDLLQTFAAQSVLAIQNANLFTEVEEKSRQLEMASQHKSQFLASMSHELRTPLNAIIGLTEMMVTNAARFGTEKAAEPLHRVHRAGTHLLGLINQVLDLSKIEAGKLELNPDLVALAPLINEVVGHGAAAGGAE